MTMRERFNGLVAASLEDNPRVAVVIAEISAASLPRHARLYNVGIREQLMIGVAAGLALEGFRPIAHSYAPFLVERPYEQLKIDLSHQGIGAVLVSVGASYDGSRSGRTHQAPADVALVSALPGWTVEVPGHPEEVAPAFADALAVDDPVYVRLTEETNAAPHDGRRITILRRGSGRGPFVLAIGPTLEQVLEATRDLDATVGYLTRVRPFPAGDLRETAARDVVLVEPYLAGTSAAEVSTALADRPHRLLALGVENRDLRRYGLPTEHRAAHGLDAAGIRRKVAAFATA